MNINIARRANNESSEICGIIKPGRRVKLNRSQAVNVHKLLTIRFLRPALASVQPFLLDRIQIMARIQSHTV